MTQHISEHALRWALVIGVLALAGAAVARVVRTLRRSQSPNPVVTFEPGWELLAAGLGVRPSRGDAKVVVVEFFDLQCPACRTYHEILRRAQVEFDRDLEIKYVHFPLQTHVHALGAARAAECARAQGAFQDFLDVAYRNQEAIGDRSWESFGTEAGVGDSAAFAGCVAETDTVLAIAEGRRMGEALGVSATPTLLLNGWRFKYPPSEDLLFETIRRLRDGKEPRGAGLERLGEGQLRANRTVRAGVTVISYPAATRDALPRLGLADHPDVAFGSGEPGSVDLQGVRAVKALSGGRIVALDRYGPTIYAFDSEGRVVATLGRLGDGPGELRTVHDLVVLPGDSVAVLDQTAWRLSVFALDGGVRTEQMPADLQTRFARLVGRLSTGELVVSSVPTVRAPDSQDRARLPLAVAVVDPALNHRQILELPDFDVALQATNFGGRRGMTPTFVRLAARAHVKVLDSTIAATTGEEFLVTFYGRTGRPMRELRLEVPRRRVTESMREEQVARDLDVLHNVMREPPQYMEESERVLREAPYAEWLPAIDDLVESTDGLLWVLEGSAPTDTTWSALAFEPSGALVRRVQGPAPLRPVLFRVGNVVVRTTNADGLVGFESRAFRRLD